MHFQSIYSAQRNASPRFLGYRKIHTLGTSQTLQASSQFKIHEHKWKAMLIFTLKEPFFVVGRMKENLQEINTTKSGKWNKWKINGHKVLSGRRIQGLTAAFMILLLSQYSKTMLGREGHGRTQAIKVKSSQSAPSRNPNPIHYQQCIPFIPAGTRSVPALEAGIWHTWKSQLSL